MVSMAGQSKSALALKKIRERVGLSVREVARQLGYEETRASSYAYYEDEYKKSYLPIDLIEKLGPIFIPLGAEQEELLALAGVKRAAGMAEEQRYFDLKPANVLKPGTSPYLIDFGGMEFALIPAYDIQAAAGPGSINDPDGSPLYQHPYSHEWLRTVTRAPLDSLAIIRVSGDSMQDTLFNGDHVLVDRTVRQVGRDGIYILRYSASDELRVKRCIRSARTKLLMIKSDNGAYPPEPDVRDEDIHIEGRVVWLGRNIGG